MRRRKEQNFVGNQNPKVATEPLAPPDAVSDNGPVQTARYTLHVPMKDNDGRNIPHVLGAVRQTLTYVGLHGRTVLKGEGDWMDFESEDMALVMVDAPNNEHTDYLIKTIAEGIKALSGQEAVYVSKAPLETWLI
jgi:hypothetical protein